MRTTHRSPTGAVWTVAAAAVLAACGSGSADSPTAAGSPSTTDAPPVTTIAPARTITVDATGVARGTPDTMSLTLAVELQAPTTREVLDAVAAQSTALHDFLVASGIPEDQLQTTQLSVYPVYGAYTEMGVGVITGYSATVSLSVLTADLAAASTLVDGAADVVGDALRVTGLQWSMANSDELTAAARADAVDAARVQAAQLAEAAGLTLGDIVSVTENLESAYGYGMGEGDSSAIPFDPGTGTVRVSVTVTFEAS
jgi:uncharacterized protein YggE